jgi:glycosyltransferase involved in cell wall biosynthesis
MKISVILCTYNRCQSLAKALSSIAASVLPDTVEWEVLVVDNNSSDRTAFVAGSFVGIFPGRFHYIFEPRQGKSFALNAGVREARGEILAFLDDDVIVEPTWLWNLTANLHDGTWAGAGGRTLPLVEQPLPEWLSLERPYSLGAAICGQFDEGGMPRELEKPPYGANMAFRQETFTRYGPFRTDLGPGLVRPVSKVGEDTEFGSRVMSGGERVRYEPAAIVHHPIFPDRMSKKYIRNFCYETGKYESIEIGRRPAIRGIPRRYLSMAKLLLVILPDFTLRWVSKFDPMRRFHAQCALWREVGRFVGLYRQEFAQLRKRLEVDNQKCASP